MDEVDPLENFIDKEEQIRIFSDLAKIEGLQEYLRALMSRDMRIHFTCPKEQQDLARGAYFRTEYLSKKIGQYSLDSNK